MAVCVLERQRQTQPHFFVVFALDWLRGLESLHTNCFIVLVIVKSIFLTKNKSRHHCCEQRRSSPVYDTTLRLRLATRQLSIIWRDFKKSATEFRASGTQASELFTARSQRSRLQEDEDVCVTVLSDPAGSVPDALQWCRLFSAGFGSATPQTSAKSSRPWSGCAG